MNKPVLNNALELASTTSFGVVASVLTLGTSSSSSTSSTGTSSAGGTRRSRSEDPWKHPQD